MAALDRYLAIACYECYKKKVTNRDVIVLISVTSALTFVIITSPFWTGYLSVYTCSINLARMHWVLAWNLLLGLVCPVF
jgi:5-hydroxytryptamine receptor 1